jgi:hypothetical protein
MIAAGQKSRPNAKLKARVGEVLRTINSPVSFAEWTGTHSVIVTANRDIIHAIQRLLPDALTLRFGFMAAMPEHVKEIGHGSYFIELRFPDDS